MDPLPHRYEVHLRALPQGPVALATADGASLECQPPPQFGGPAGAQSPEYLLTEALAGCFALTFRALAEASGLSWQNLRCRALGTLDRVEGRLAFSGFELEAHLELSEEGVRERAARLLEKAERQCLVAASLACPVRLAATVAIRPTESAR